MYANKNIKLIVRQMQSTDCEEVRQILTSLGFLISKYDNEVMMKFDAKGIFVAQDLNNGKIFGSCNGVNLSPELAHFGQYSCLKEYQGLGIGAELWRTAMEHTGTDRNLSLLARPVMANKYRDRFNFTLIPQKLNVCFRGKVDCNQLIQTIDGISVLPINDDNIEKVIQYDKEVCDGFDRTVLIKENAKFEEYANRVAVNQNNEVLGYCMLKVSNFNTGIVEPLYANNEKIAELLLRKSIESLDIAKKEGFIYNCWNTNKKSVEIAKKLGLSPASEFPILFTKKIIEGDLDRIYCLSSRAFYPF